MLNSVLEIVLAGFGGLMALFAGYQSIKSSQHKKDRDFAKDAAGIEQARAEQAERERDAVKHEAAVLNAINKEATRLNTQQKEALDAIHNHPADRDAFDNRS